MTGANELVLNFLVNSTWQIAAIFVLGSIGAYFLKTSSAHYRYIVWVTALFVCLIAPVITATQIVPTLTISSRSYSNSQPLNTTTDDEVLVDHTRRRSSQVVVNTTPRRMQLIAVAYCLFLGLCSLRFVRLWRTKERVRRSVSFTGLTAPIKAASKRCGALLGIERVQLGRSSAALVPCTLGIQHPLIVLPDSFCGDVDQETLLSVIGHEMAHVRRKDFLTKLVCELISLPISFHPLTFLLKRQIERERELACDELVTQRVLQAPTYARSLLRAADLSTLPARRTMMLSVFDGRMLEERIRRLLHKRLTANKWSGRIITAVVLGAICTSSVLGSVFGFSFQPQRGTKETGVSAPGLDLSREPVTEHVRQGTDVRVATRTVSPVQQEPQQLAQAACDAGRKRDVQAIPSLVAMLGDDRQVEPIACYTNGRWTPALDTFKRPSPGEQAALALASMGRDALGPLMNELDNSNAATRRNAAWAIGELTNMIPGQRAAAVPQLVTLLRDTDPWVRMAAARAIGEIRDRRASETLIITLSDADWRVRRLAAWALGEMKEQQAVAALSNSLITDARAEVRAEAASALAEIRSAEARSALELATNDADERVRRMALFALVEIH